MPTGGECGQAVQCRQLHLTSVEAVACYESNPFTKGYRGVDPLMSAKLC